MTNQSFEFQAELSKMNRKVHWKETPDKLKDIKHDIFTKLCHLQGTDDYLNSLNLAKETLIKLSKD